ncbi:MAG: hypothetical protein AB8B85_16320 [Paracoccaceae bacterium]
MAKILPCPFCGGEQTTLDPELDLVFCNDCHAESGLDGLSGWNKRDIMGALYAVLAHLRETGVPSDTGKIFEARLARAAEPDAADPDGHFKRDLSEALVTMIKCIRAQAAEAAKEDRAAQ